MMTRVELEFERTTEDVYRALIDGIRRFFTSANAKTACLGLSGGLDSAVVLALAVEALGAQNVRVLLMPSEFSTVHSIADALSIADRLNVRHDIIDINPIFKEFNKSLHPIFKGMENDVTEENLQARIRGTLLMALSNKMGNLVLNTSNKSELAVGYGTLYGDLCGALSVIGDVYKSQAYALASYINIDGEIIPRNTIVKAPSAELRPNQKDSDSLPDYNLLDSVLIRMIEQGKAPEDIVKEGFDSALVARVEKMTKGSKFKSLQIPPIIKISSKPVVESYKWV